MLSLIVRGTPVATPFAVPMLDRMSLRTTPLCVNTLGPLVPSPGYGPAVSAGIFVQPVTAAAVVVEVVPMVVDVAPGVVLGAVVAPVVVLEAAVVPPSSPQP